MQTKVKSTKRNATKQQQHQTSEIENILKYTFQIQFYRDFMELLELANQNRTTSCILLCQKLEHLVKTKTKLTCNNLLNYA